MTDALIRFYHFCPVDDPSDWRDRLLPVAAGATLTGTILIAREGINGSLSGPQEGLDRLAAALRALPGCGGMAIHRDPVPKAAFRRLKVKVRPEIVTLGLPDLPPDGQTGTRVAPEDWNRVLDDPAIPVIDLRNAFEVDQGTFAGAIDPGLASFGRFRDWWAAQAPALAGRPVAMFCTGGIRCEKASRWLLSQGVPEVLQLDGGILGYLARIPPDQSRWQGACFVFDERGAVGHGLTPVSG